MQEVQLVHENNEIQNISNIYSLNRLPKVVYTCDLLEFQLKNIKKQHFYDALYA